MKLSEIYKIADEIAPKRLSDELCSRYGMYDNSGILVDVGEEIHGILFSLDLSTAAINEAMAMGANLIITHHPAIYGKISRIDYHDEGILGNKLIRCIRHGISVVAMHLNLDAAQDGIDESLMQGICLSAGGTEAPCTQPILQFPVDGGAYGRAYCVENTALGDLAEAMGAVFSTDRVEVYGEPSSPIERVASFCGAGADEGSVAFAKQNGAQVMISSDFKHHVLSLALESGVSVITLTHYASENYGYKKYYEKICRQVEIPCYYHEDSILL